MKYVPDIDEGLQEYYEGKEPDTIPHPREERMFLGLCMLKHLSGPRGSWNRRVNVLEVVGLNKGRGDGRLFDPEEDLIEVRDEEGKRTVICHLRTPLTSWVTGDELHLELPLALDVGTAFPYWPDIETQRTCEERAYNYYVMWTSIKAEGLLRTTLANLKEKADPVRWKSCGVMSSKSAARYSQPYHNARLAGESRFWGNYVWGTPRFVQEDISEKLAMPGVQLHEALQLPKWLVRTLYSSPQGLQPYVDQLADLNPDVGRRVIRFLNRGYAETHGNKFYGFVRFCSLDFTCVSRLICVAQKATDLPEWLGKKSNAQMRNMVNLINSLGDCPEVIWRPCNSIAQLKQAIHRFHADTQRHGRYQSPEVKFSAPFANNLIVNAEHCELTLHRLQSGADLIREGMDMSHCIGQYAHRGEEHGFYAVILKKGDKTVGRASLMITKLGIIEQLYGKANELPGDLMRAIVQDNVHKLVEKFKETPWL